MQSEEKNNKSLLWLTALFAIVVIVAVVIVSIPDEEIPYEKEPGEMLTTILEREYLVTPVEASKYLVEEQNDSYTFVDIRDAQDYVKGHLPGAVSIPATDLLSDENLQFIRGNAKTIVLYGNDQVEACSPFMILRQIGLENIKVLLGGYAYMDNYMNPGENTARADYRNEEPRYDFKKIQEETAGSSISSPATEMQVPDLPTGGKKTKRVQGGC